MKDLSLQRTELSSGVRVVSEHVPAVRSVSLGVWIDTGSRDEADGEQGLSHFLEHMLFKGTPDMNAREIAEAFDHMGADVNAVTGREHTSVYSRMLDEYVPEAVEMILDMVRRPVLDSKDLDAERQVVLEEISMHMDSPDELVHDYLARALWGEHPLGRSVLGESGIIKSVDHDFMSGFHDGRYVTSRMVIAAAGAVDHERLCELMEEKTSDISKGEAVVRVDVLDKPLSNTIIRNKDTEQAHITLGSRGLARRHPERFALAVMDNIMGGSMSSRLFQRIREEKGLVYSIYSYNGMFIGMGMVGIYCGTHPTQAQKVIGLVEDELVKVKEMGFSEEELARAKNHIKGSLLISMEDSGNRMNRIAKAEMSGGEHLTVDEMVARVEKVSLEDLSRVFADTWGSVPASLAVVGPFNDGELTLSGRI